jgi:hypothetical protein
MQFRGTAVMRMQFTGTAVQSLSTEYPAVFCVIVLAVEVPW